MTRPELMGYHRASLLSVDLDRLLVGDDNDH